MIKNLNKSIAQGTCIFLAFIILFPSPAHAIIAAAPAVAAISVLQMFSLAVLFILIPTTLIGLILRILGAKKLQTESGT